MEFRVGHRYLDGLGREHTCILIMKNSKYPIVTRYKDPELGTLVTFRDTNGKIQTECDPSDKCDKPRPEQDLVSKLRCVWISQ